MPKQINIFGHTFSGFVNWGGPAEWHFDWVPFDGTYNLYIGIGLVVFEFSWWRNS